MIKDIKLIINDKEVPFPEDINMNDILNEIMNNIPTLEKSNKKIVPKQIPLTHPTINEIIFRKHKNNDTRCKDTEARKIIFEINQRLLHIENYLSKVFPTKKKHIKSKMKPLKIKPTKKVVKKKSVQNKKKKSR